MVQEKGGTHAHLPDDIGKMVRRWNVLLVVFALLVLVAWSIGLFVVGADKDQGDVYRIIFVHVPSAWSAFLWVIVSGVFAVLGFMRKGRSEAYDRSSHAAMELGTLYAALALVTGMIWGRPTWGVWWDWDPRLTSTLVMFLVTCGYHILRSFTPDANARRNVAGVIAILGSVNVPIVYYSVNLWRSLHQPQTFVRQGSTASSDIGIVLYTNVIVLVLFTVALYKVRRQGISAAESLLTARESH